MAKEKAKQVDDLQTPDPDQAPVSKGPLTIREKHPEKAESVFKRFAARQLMYETEEVEDIQNLVFMRSGCLPFDLITEGKGLPRGRTMLLYSPPGVGKTTLLFAAARGFCQSGYKVVYADGESSDDTAAQMGLIGPDHNLQVPKGSFRYLSFSFYAELEAIANAFLESDYDILMVDSITAAGISRKTRLKALEKKKTVEDPTAIGAEARIQSVLVKNLFLDIKDGPQSIVFIAQERNKIDMKNPSNNGTKAAASNASLFFANIIVKMKPSILLKDGMRVIGRLANLFSEKNRHGQCFTNIPTTVFFGRGVSNIDVLIKVGVWLGIFKSSRSGWYEINIPGKEPDKVQGTTGLGNWIKDHYDVMLSLFYDNAREFLIYLANGEKDVTNAEALLGARPSSSGGEPEYDSSSEESSGETGDLMDLVDQALAEDEEVIDLG